MAAQALTFYLVVQAPGNNTTWNYYFAGYRSEEDDPSGTQHVLYYNPRGKAQFEIQDLAGLNLVTKTLYDGLDRVASTTQPEGGSVAYAYDGATNPWANNVASITRNPKPGSPLAPLTTSYSYDPAFNKPVSVTDPLGLLTLMSYDPATGNLLSSVSDAGGGSHFNARKSFTYDGQGLLLSATDPLGVVTRYQYDSFGNRTSTTGDFGGNGLNQLTMMSYNDQGDVTSVTDARGNVTTNSYDAARRLVATTSPATAAAPAGIATNLSYDADGRTIRAQQSANASVLRTTRATYTPSGKPATATDANGNTTSYAYDLLDRLASTTDAAGRVTTYAYDALSRQTQTFNKAIQSAALLQVGYSTDGLPATLTDANNNATNFAYDGFDRIATTTYPGGSTETATYDADGNTVTRKTRANGTTILAYDTLNRLATKTPPSGAVVNYSYNLNNSLTGVSDNSAAVTAAAPPTPNTLYATNYAYDSLNRPTNANWTPAATAMSPAAGSTVTFGHAYDKANQRIGQSVTDNTWLSYPAAAPGTTSYSANSLNQYSAVGTVTPAYDANGNLTNDGTFTFVYDAENRLVSASGAGNTASYAFDGRGRRKSQTVNGATTVSVTDADNREVLEYDGASGTVLRWYTYGLGANGVLGQMNVAAATRATLLPDIQASIIGSLDSSTGLLSSFAYQVYGRSAAPSAQFGYTGQRIDPETNGLYYYRARHYSPVLGRFLQPDPVGYTAGANLYAYVGNDPLNNNDPDGNCPWCIGGALIGFSVDLAAQLVISGTYDWKQSLAATGAGALTGGASVIIAKTIVTVGGQAIANAAVGAVVNGAQAAALNTIEGRDNSIVTAAALGAVGGYFGTYIGDSFATSSAARSQAGFDALSTSDKLNVLGTMQSNPNVSFGIPQPGAVALGNAASAGLGDVVTSLPPETLSPISSAQGATLPASTSPSTSFGK